ncbi:MAG: DUF192 domain-containing protein [Actinomycetota bacterium]
MHRTALLAVAVVAALTAPLVACRDDREPVHRSAGNRILVRIHTHGGVVELTDLEMARTPKARAVGLMGRTELGEGGGMVFLFDEPTTGAFWMKDTLIPLSIAFWEEDGDITDILDMRLCRSDPCPLYRASEPFVGAIEMNRGAFDRLGVEVGDTVEYRLLTE